MKKIIILLIALMVMSVGFLSGCNEQKATEGPTDNSIYVENRTPTASCSANPLSGTEPLTVYFVGYGSDTDGSISSYSWDFGDGRTSSEKSPSHTFQKGGIYSVRFTVTDDDGAKDSEYVTIVVKEKSDIVITSDYKKDGFEGANRVGYVYVTVKNNGGIGSGTVHVWIAQGDEDWEKIQSVYLDTGESESLIFRFTEIHFWTLESWDYIVWVE